MNLHDKVILITGASRGLGRALARQLAGRGAKLALVSRRPEEWGPEVLTIAADVGQQAEEIVERTLARFGRLDVLINNASTIGSSPMPRLDQLAWQELEMVLRTNLLAPFHLTRLALPYLETLVNISSDAGVEAYAGWGAYGISKAALEHMTRILAAEQGQRLRVLLVDPGDMNTRMHQQAEPGVDLTALPLPEEVAPDLIRHLEQPGAAFQRVRLLPVVVR